MLTFIAILSMILYLSSAIMSPAVSSEHDSIHFAGWSQNLYTYIDPSDTSSIRTTVAYPGDSGNSRA